MEHAAPQPVGADDSVRLPSKPFGAAPPNLCDLMCPAGAGFALSQCMSDEDRRLLAWCRMGLLAGAAIHWIATILLLVDLAGGHASGWEQLASLMRVMI